MKRACSSLCVLAAFTAAFWSHPPTASATPSDWQVKKCQIYRSAWNDLPSVMDTTRFTASFKALNETFMAAGCLDHTAICPQNPAEIQAANILTIAAMNGGTASTFLPFRC